MKMQEKMSMNKFDGRTTGASLNQMTMMSSKDKHGKMKQAGL